MFDANENDPISPAMRALLEVFSTELSEVKFPDVDAEVLDAVRTFLAGALVTPVSAVSS